jgi:hypothetical protein
MNTRPSEKVTGFLSGMKKRSERLSAGARSKGWLRFSVMKAPIVFLGELTNSELESWLEKSSTVIIPVGVLPARGENPLRKQLVARAEKLPFRGRIHDLRW